MGSGPLNVWKMILLILSFLILLTSFRGVWIWYHQALEHPVAEQGMIDLSDWDFTDDKPITLDGEWEFYPYSFLSPEAEIRGQEDMQFIDVPSTFNEAVSKQDKDTDAYGYGRLIIQACTSERAASACTGFFYV